MANQIICCVRGCVNPAAEPLGFCCAHVDAIKSGREVRIAVAECVFDGCDKPPHSAMFPYCTAHNARMRRRGHMNLASRAEVLYHTSGYRLVMAVGHPMAKGKARAYEHRVVFYNANPEGPGACHWCGTDLNWTTLQVDHVNAIRDDNRIENLVASCGDCNRDRAKPAYVKAARDAARIYMVNGKWLSIQDAADRIGVSRNSITARLKSGWSVERAFSEKRGPTGPRRLTVTGK